MKGKKIIVSALAATMVAAPVATLGGVAKNVYAEDSSTENNYTVLGPELSIVRSSYKATADKGDVITVPEYSAESGVKCDVTVVDPLGKEVTLGGTKTDGTPLGAREFEAKIAGVYTYKFNAYKVTAGEQSSVATTYELTLTVKGDTGSIEIPENSYFVIPSEFKTGSKLTVPVPTCFANDTEVKFDSAQTEGEAKIVAYLNDEEMTFVPAVAGDDAKAENKAHFEKTVATAGSYKLVYKLIYKNEEVAVSSSKTIKVKDTLSATKLYANYAKTPSKTAEAGVKYDLVDLNVSLTENSTNYVDAFTSITVKHIETGEMMVVDYENMSFVPKYTGNYFVTYKAMIPSLGLESDELRYNIVNVQDTTQPVLYLTGDYYLDASTGKTYNKTFGYYDATENKYYTNADKTTEVTGVEEITDKDMADVYDIIGNREHYVRSYYELGADGKVNVYLPAAYVRDDYRKANEITVSRELYVSTTIDDQHKLTLVKTDDSENPAYNEVAKYTFDTNGKYGVGTYTVRYIIQDKDNTPLTSDFTIVIRKNGSIVEDSTTHKKNVPTLTFTYDEESAKTTDTITFAVPTATDNYDTNLDTNVYYSFDTELNAGNILEKIANGEAVRLLNADKNDDGKFEIDLEKVLPSTTPQFMYIAALSRNSYNSDVVELSRNFIVKKVKLVGGNNDTVAPTYTTRTWDQIRPELEGTSGKTLNDQGYVTGTNKALFDQDDVITIPSFTFVEDDSEMEFKIRVSYMLNGEQVVVDALENGFNHEVTESAGKFTHVISGATFKANYAKLYTVTIIAIDSNENTSLVSFGVRVNDTKPPVVQVVNKDKFSKDAEVGNVFKIPTPDIIDDGEVDGDGTWSWSVKWPNGKVFNYTSYTKQFTPTEIGTYTITYKGKDKNGLATESNEYLLNVVATEKPEITYNKVMPSYDIEWDKNAETQAKVKIPTVSAKDKYYNGQIIVDAPKVVDGKGDDVTLELSEDGQWYEFVPKTQGKYTVTYTANGHWLSNSKSFTLNIGDTEAPTLVWNDKDADLKQTAEIGDTWTFKFDMINVEDNKDEMSTIISNILKDGVTSTSLDNLKKYATITMTKDSETVDYEIADNGLKYTFNSSGDYKFTIKLIDEAGNSSDTEYSYTITVKEPEKTNENKNTNAVGTVLIVLSVVILAGVVSYFVITTKKVDKKAVEAKGKKKKDNK